MINQAEAKLLHEKNPGAFLDENHKPEMAVALTDFTALAGFRDPSQILAFAEKIEEFAEILGEETVELLRSEETAERKLRQCYWAIFSPGHSRDFLPLQRVKWVRLPQDVYLVSLYTKENRTTGICHD